MTLSKREDQRKESLKTTLLRWGFNVFPAYLSTGARVTFLSSDYQEVQVKLPYGWRSRDHKGELFKGFQYAAVDPIYPMILENKLGDDYEITEEESNVHFNEPCREMLRAQVEITDEELERIRDELNHHDSVIRVYKIELTGEDGTVYTEVEKTLSIKSNI